MSTESEDKPATRRGQASKPKTQRQARKYAEQYRDLESRVNFALSILRRATGEGVASKELVAVAIETLEGKGD